MSEQRVCPECASRVDVTPSNHLRAHACPHGEPCQLSYKQRRLGVVRRPCRVCVSARHSKQGRLFADG